jgi:hypothetical protein
VAARLKPCPDDERKSRSLARLGMTECAFFLQIGKVVPDKEQQP